MWGEGGGGWCQIEGNSFPKAVSRQECLSGHVIAGVILPWSCIKTIILIINFKQLPEGGGRCGTWENSMSGAWRQCRMLREGAASRHTGYTLWLWRHAPAFQWRLWFKRVVLLHSKLTERASPEGPTVTKQVDPILHCPLSSSSNEVCLLRHSAS